MNMPLVACKIKLRIPFSSKRDLALFGAGGQFSKNIQPLVFLFSPFLPALRDNLSPTQGESEVAYVNNMLPRSWSGLVPGKKRRQNSFFKWPYLETQIKRKVGWSASLSHLYHSLHACRVSFVPPFKVLHYVAI